MREVRDRSLAELAAPLRGLRVLLWGFSGRGFPGGDGAAEAVECLPRAGVETTHTSPGDPLRGEKLGRRYDVAIVCNTRVGEVLQSDPRLWSCAETRCYWFWDLRPGHVGAPLKGKVDRVFLSYDGPWKSPQGLLFDPRGWAEALGCPVGYCPQGSPLREPVLEPGGPRVVFVGDLANPTYHTGRRELCKALGAVVVNEKARPDRLAVEARLPTLYRSARYVLSASPRAPGYTSVRTYSILACGGLMLLHRFEGADRLLRSGEHAVLFDEGAALKPRLEYLDGAPLERARIADNGRRLHAERHTVAHRVLSICREVAGVSAEFSGWH